MIRRHRQPDDAEINLTPMLDVTFIMLIFFIVTTSFVKEAGAEVRRPAAVEAELKQKGSVMIAIRQNGEVWMQSRQVAMPDVRRLVEESRAENPEGTAVIIADRDSDIDTFVQVMDQVKLAGMEAIAVAAEQPSEG